MAEVGRPSFEDLFNLAEIQRLQDEFAAATSVASIITNTDGSPITTPSNFCRLCLDVIRKTEKGRANCFRSDAALGVRRVEAPEIARAIVDAGGCLLSAVSYLESAMVLIGRTGVGAVDDLDALIDQAGVEVVPFDRPQSKLAREAFLRFGKGRHPAALNFGDCASYALASGRALPLLFKGKDFMQSDITAVRLKRE